MDTSRSRWVELVPWAGSAVLITSLVLTWAARVGHPYDLEWMEGGMLAHAWRVAEGLPVYPAPGPDFVPFVYPPGYADLLAVLGAVTGLGLPLGRAVSLVGTLGAAAAVGFAVSRHGPRGPAGAFAAVVFLGAWPGSGAFYDLVRPDALALALLAWSIALSVERWRGAAEAAGLLLAAAFAVKHSHALFGLPIALTLWWRDGPRVAARFALAAAAPALLLAGFLQWRTEGRFLTYLLAVPASHPMVAERVIPGLPRELGNALPIATALPAAWLVMRRIGGRWPDGLLIAGPVWAGIALGWWTAGEAIGGADRLHLPAGLGAWALGAGAVAVALTAAQSHPDARPSWRWVWGVSLAGTAVAQAALMRAHNGGYLNVYMPLHWVACVGFGLVLARVRGGGRPGLAALAVTLQLAYAIGTLDGRRYRPTAADRDAGDRFVEALEQVDGPVLSPFAAWLPVQAGHPPSLHLIAAWDLAYPDGPWPGFEAEITEAVADRHWGAVVGGSRAFLVPLDPGYVPERAIADKGGVMAPKSGWPARPTRILVPR